MRVNDIVISGFGSVSPLGATAHEVGQSYANGKSAISLIEISGQEVYAAPVHSSVEILLQAFVLEHPEYRKLDRSVLLAILAARGALERSGWTSGEANCGVSFGSSRGATGLFEHFHSAFLQHPRGVVSAHSSPTTTLGNLSSWVAQDLGLGHATLSHSSTCSSSVHSLANAMAWIRAGMAERFLAGGSEAALTGFTIAQMQALGIYAESTQDDCACRPCATNADNTFVLGEGAACFAIESAESFVARKSAHPALAKLESVGLAMENLSSPTSISSEATCLSRAMNNAMASMQTGDIDAVILHAPGTKQGDDAELSAVRSVFGDRPPTLLSNKWLIGHTLGASGALSVEYALMLLQGSAVVMPPYANRLGGKKPVKIRKVMVNSAGFGGNAASVVLSATD